MTTIDSIDDKGIVALMRKIQGKVFSKAMYREFKIPKATGGMRTILAPNEELMEIQQLILTVLNGMKVAASPYACAYIHGKGIVDMAKNHVGKAVAVKVDLKDFFPKIGKAAVREALIRNGVSPRAAILDIVMAWCFYDNGLPIGAPTSPFLSNVVAIDLDYRLAALCKKWRAVTAHGSLYTMRGTKVREFCMSPIEYSRYADDLCFSSNYKKLPEMIYAIKRVITRCGFVVNEKKVRVMRKGRPMEIVGVSLNKLGKRTKKRRELRQQLHQIAINVESGRLPKGKMFQRVKTKSGVIESIVDINMNELRGQVAHIKHLNAEQAKPFEVLLQRIERIA